MENSFTIRHYVPEKDLFPLSRMLTEIEAIDRDGEDTSEEYLRSMTEWPNFDPEESVWVAEADGILVGFARILPRQDNVSSIYVVVHQAQRRKGLGGKLLDLSLARARQTKSRTFLIYANAHNLASNDFVKHYGFELAATSGVMVAPVPDVAQAEIPLGYSLRRYPEVGEPTIVVQALDQCYKDMLGHHQNVTSADRYMNYYGEEGIHLLFNENDTLIGICTGKPQGKTDERGVSHLLDAPGLIKEYRSRGFQRFLTLAVMNWLCEKGMYPITLEYWGDDDQAINIYRELGFELVQQQIAYRKEVL